MATKLNITGNTEHEFSINAEKGKAILEQIQKNQDKTSGTYKKSQGGTERMYQRLMSELPEDIKKDFQIICSRVRDIDDSKIKILWHHDTWDDPENTHLREEKSRKRFDKQVFVSNHQLQTFNMGLGVPYSEGIVIKNAIDPIDEALINKVDPKEQVRLIYHTTPHRGLELLIPCFLWLCERHDNLHLDVFSSFEIYGWGHRDEQYEKVINTCKEHPNITYHGFQPHDKIVEALCKAHLFAFPSIWPETSCIALLEAMSARCITVAPNYAALPETAASFATMYQWTENSQDHANRFATIMDGVINGIKQGYSAWEAQLGVQKNYFDNFYAWKNRAMEWKIFLQGIRDEKKNKEKS